MNEERTKKKNTWKWVVGIAALAFVVATCIAAVTFRSVPYPFLRGATLQQVEIMDLTALMAPMGAPPPAGTPSSMTYKIYTSPLEQEELARLMREDLTAADGWTDVGASMGGLGMMGDTVMFQKGATLMIMAVPLTPEALMGAPFAGQLMGQGKTMVMITSETTFMDKVTDKLHRDKLPSLLPPAAGP
jgi:hypothetical protein